MPSFGASPSGSAGAIVGCPAPFVGAVLGLRRTGSVFLLLVLVSSPLMAQGVYDRGMQETALLQDPRNVLAPIPKALGGGADWVRALRFGQIAPRETLWGLPRQADALGEAPKDGIVFPNTRYMPFAVFPHAPHVEWLACSNCHDALFPRQKTGRLQGMTAIFEGKSCGVCHGTVAFAPEGSCYRCHSMPNPLAIQAGSPFVEPKEVEKAESEEEERGGWFKPRRKQEPRPHIQRAPQPGQ